MDNKTSIILSATDKTQAAFASAKRNLEGLKNAAGGLNTALASVGAGLSVGAFAAFVKNSIDAADNLNDLSKKTGIAVENLAGLQLVVDKSGTTMEMLGGGVAKLNKKLGEAALGGKEAQTLLRDLGITAADPIEAFYQLADAFGRFKNEGEKADAMSRVIGKTWGELAPALAEGGDGLRRMVEEGKRLNPVTKEMAEQADKFNDAMSRFKAQAAGVGTAIATGILPAMNDMLERWNDAIRLSAKHGGFVSLVLNGVNPTGANSDNLQKVTEELKKQQAIQAASTRLGFGKNSATEAEIIRLTELRASLLEIQRREALALNDKSGTGNYKQVTPPGPKKITLTPSGGTKSTRKSDRITAADWALEEAAHLTRTLYQLGEEIEKAQSDAFDQAVETAEEWQSGLDGANEQMRQARVALIDLLDPIEKYRRELDNVDTLLEGGLITPDQATAARFYWQEQIDAAAGFGAEITKVRSLTEDLGLTFESAFEGAIVEGKALSDVLNSLAQDVTRVFLRKTVTEPLGNWASSFFAGLFPSALGNVFAGGVPVRAFATGGVVSSPTVFPLGLMGEAGPEAIMPLKRGRDGKLGVTGGGGTTINMVVHANDANSVRASMGQIKADLARAVSSARRNL